MKWVSFIISIRSIYAIKHISLLILFSDYRIIQSCQCEMIIDEKMNSKNMWRYVNIEIPQ